MNVPAATAVSTMSFKLPPGEGVGVGVGSGSGEGVGVGVGVAVGVAAGAGGRSTSSNVDHAIAAIHVGGSHCGSVHLDGASVDGNCNGFSSIMLCTAKMLCPAMFGIRLESILSGLESVRNLFGVRLEIYSVRN